MSVCAGGAVRQLFLVVAIVSGALALFLTKAFTIDDPLFLWLGRHLQSHPFDFFGFDVNWNGIAAPMYKITRNPPLTGYFIAAAAGVVGWSEAALHAAFLLPAAAAAAATFLLAQRLCRRPLEATLIGLLTPVFLVSSSTVMCDTTMLAFWCASLWCWLEGLDRGRTSWLLAGSALAVLAGQAKYFGVSLVPLMLAYAAIRTRRIGAWLPCALLPLAAIAGFEILTRSLYGDGLLWRSAEYAGSFATEMRPGWAPQAFIGLVFSGGCLIPALCFAPLLWSRALLAAGLVGLLACALVPRATLELAGIASLPGEPVPWATLLQLGLHALAGASLVALVAAELRWRRDPESWLLALWVLGTLFFAAFVNWTNNGRSNLPLAPALGILIVRRLEHLSERGARISRRARALAFAPGVALALLVAWGDQRWANDVRAAARDLGRWYARGEGVTYFQGHWGLQYYMEQAGAKALDYRRDRIRRGDRIIVPSFNYGLHPTAHIALLDELAPDPRRWVSTMSPELGAGFYASNIGPLPYAFGPRPPDRYRIWRAEADSEYSLDWLKEKVKKRLQRKSGDGRSGSG